MGLSWEDAVEGGGRTGRLVEVLSRNDAGSVVVWGGDLGVVGVNGADARGSFCGVPQTGDEVEAKNLKDGLW